MKKSRLIIFSLLVVLVFTGCKKEATTKPPVEDQAFTWNKKQDKRFGNFDYLNISEDELNKLMKEKFELEIPEFSKKAETVIDTALKTDDNELEPQVFSLIATGDELRVFTEKYYKNKDGKRHSYGRIEWSYVYIKAKKEAYLSKQIVDIFNDSEEGNNYVLDPDKTINTLADMMKVPNLDSKMTQFNEQYNMPKDQLSGKDLFIIDTVTQAEADRELARNLWMNFSDTGTLVQIHALVRDFSI